MALCFSDKAFETKCVHVSLIRDRGHLYLFSGEFFRGGRCELIVWFLFLMQIHDSAIGT